MTLSEQQQVLHWVESCLLRLEETRVHLIVCNNHPTSEARAGVCLAEASLKMKELVGLWGMLNQGKEQNP